MTEDSQETRNDIHWTLKGPLWLLSLLFWGGAIFMGYRGRVVAAIIAVVMALGFAFWSYQYKDWCELHTMTWGQHAWGQAAFGGTLGECLKLKGWWQF